MPARADSRAYSAGVSSFAPIFDDERSFRAGAPSASDDFLRSIPETDAFADDDTSLSVGVGSGGGAPMMPAAPIRQVPVHPAPTMARSAGQGSRFGMRAPIRRPASLMSRIGSGIKRAWSGLRSLFSRRTRPEPGGLGPSRGAGFWNDPHPALNRVEAERSDPFVSRDLMRPRYERADPYAGMADPDSYVPVDTPSPQSAPNFGGAFRTPGLGESPTAIAAQQMQGSVDESGTSSDNDADDIYDEMPRTGSFVGLESPPQSVAPVEAPRPAGAPQRTGYEARGWATHYLDEMSAESRRRKWAEAD